ncbi:MAG: hypothetical protein K9L68_01515 [Spirochaetales bacterium]|nr:hypothetical protein [Spirochaetales bacterium]
MKAFLRFVLLGFILLVSTFSLYAADIVVPRMEFITRGYSDGGSFLLGTYGNVDLEVLGGYKFGGRLLFGIEEEEIEVGAELPAVRFRSASITTRQLFDTPLMSSYYVGDYHSFADGRLFEERFGTEHFGTRYRGFYYFPESPHYDGIYSIDGTGVSLSSEPLGGVFVPALYLYQDRRLGQGMYGSDMRLLFNLPRAKIEGFFGSSFPVSSAGIYRGGMMLYFGDPETGEFYSQIGITRWDPVKDSLGLELFYFLSEPRVHIGLVSLVLTVFIHPEYYQTVQYEDQIGAFDVNFNILIGDEQISPISGGVETTTMYQPDSTDQFRLDVAPYLRLVTSGVLWDVKVRTKVYPFVFEDAAELYVGVSAEF